MLKTNNKGLTLYNRLPEDIQFIVDNHLWLKTKKDIPEVEMLHRRLKLLLQEYPHQWDKQQKKLIDFVCWYVIKPRTYGAGYCGAETKSGKYQYVNFDPVIERDELLDYLDNVNESNEKEYLGISIRKYITYLETKKNKPSFEMLNDNIKLAIDNWVDNNIVDRDLFQHFATQLGFNIIDMFEYYYDNTGGNPFEDENYQKAIFCWYMSDMFEKLIMITYQYEIEDLDSDSDSDSDNDIPEEIQDILNAPPVYNDPSNLGIGDILVPSAYDLQFG